MAVKTRLCIITITAMLTTGAIALTAGSDFMNRKLLPEKFPVYVFNGGVVNRYYFGTRKNYLKTVNRFKGYPGCYIACYSRDQDRGVYSVGGGIYVMGQVRVKGRYIKRVCNPSGYAGKDISAAQYFKNICNKNLPQKCQNGCWAGGDTGGWFGIQRNGSLR